MYTKARIARHPIHPMLVGFPIALYAVTVVALLAHVGTGDPFWYRVALYANVAGVVMAAVAAVPGLIDLVNLPSYSRARSTGLRHAGFNVLALVLFVGSGSVMYGHWRGGVLANEVPLVLSLLGLGSTVAAGWLGWTLVQTHHVGVKPTERHETRRDQALDDLDELMPPPQAIRTKQQDAAHRWH
jgi:uncharacterized membrane protein